jgi:Cys-rich protein (TIGR01571 family)
MGCWLPVAAAAAAASRLLCFALCFLVSIAEVQGRPAPAVVIEVTCPAGVTMGQMIQIQTPAGQTVPVQVPSGVGPGIRFQVQVPTAVEAQAAPPKQAIIVGVEPPSTAAAAPVLATPQAQQAAIDPPVAIQQAIIVPQQAAVRIVHQPSFAPALPARAWSTPLMCNCCDDCSTCCLAYWCPCIVYGQVKAYTEGHPQKSTDHCIMYIFGYCAAQMVAGAGPCVTGALEMSVRDEFMRKHNLQPPQNACCIFCMFCCCGPCCGPCAYVQMIQEMQVINGAAATAAPSLQLLER